MTRQNKKTPQKRSQGSVFGKNLTALLKSKKITHKKAANLAGVSPSTIFDWCNGASPTDLIAVARLAQALSIDFQYLCIGQHSYKSIDEIPTEDLFEEAGVALEGIYKVRLIKLDRKKGKLPI